MKKALAILLTVVLLLSVPLIAFAADTHDEATCPNVPIINLGGAMTALYYEESTVEKKVAFDPSPELITGAVNNVIGKLQSALLHIPPDWDAVAMALSGMLWDVAGEIAMDEKGKSINPLISSHNTGTVINQDHTKNRAYSWDYDWRLDPCDLADDLHTFIGLVKANSKHGKVNLRAPSGASMIVTAYLAKYGTDSLNGIVLWNSMHNGMGVLGQLACKEIAIDSVALAEGKFFHLIGMDNLQTNLTLILTFLSRIGVLEIVAGVGNAALDKAIDRFYSEAVIPLFFQMPNMWGYVPHEYYEQAKKILFGDNAKYADLIAKIDNYHYNVQQKADGLLKSASEAGVKVAIVSSYGYPGIPLVKDARANTDTIVEASKSSGGATTGRFGEKFPVTYSQKIPDEHNHISPDRQIDASTCILPEQTWFIKYVYHFDPLDWRDTFAEWVFDTPGQVDVYSSDQYPQFLKWDEKTNKISPLTASSEGGFNIFSPLEWIIDLWMKVINIAVKFGTWWLPILGIHTN
ncbi:MAG: hypothetical protein LBJ12_07675 [Oscillospiraceae bacterium]|jgi:hypothetical protein|nr:hypothetical protein [Oscillospiraceae bacterium]